MLIFYESAHRLLLDSTGRYRRGIGRIRYVVLARELTKTRNHSRRAGRRAAGVGQRDENRRKGGNGALVSKGIAQTTCP